MQMSLWARTRLLPVQRDLFDYVYILLWVNALVLSGMIAIGYLVASPISQGTFLALLCVALLVHRCWYMALTLVPCMLATPNRGQWAILGMGLLANWVRHPLALLCAALALAFLYTIHPTPSDIERLQIWSAAMSELTPFGLGWGSFERIWVIRDGVAFRAVYAHNDYLQLAFELGLWAAPIFVGLAWLTLTSREAHDWPILTASLFASSFTFAIYIPLAAIITILALASVLSWRLSNA